MRARPMLSALSIVLLLGGAAALAQGGWIQGKAWLAQRLLEAAWARTLQEGQPQRAWPWADHWPVAELQLRGRRYIVLEGDRGNTLAFAPGHSPASGMPGDGLTSVISGHRDTHFAVLEHVWPGDRVALTTRRGQFHYRVSRRAVVSARRDRLSLVHDNALLLVTCWPFRASASGGDERLLVYAEPL